MTTESSQPAQPAPDAPQSAPAASSSSGNSNQLRIAVLVVIAAIVGVGLWLGLSNDKSKKNSGKSGPKVHLVSQIGPVFQSQVKLGLRPLTLAQPIYYAGPKKGYKYEFWRLPNKTVEIRYVPKSVKKAGAKPNGKQYLIIATYPFSDAYNRLKKKYKNIGVTKNGAYIVVRPGLPTNILMAWPKVDYEVEVFDPNPQKAAAIAESGQVGPVS